MVILKCYRAYASSEQLYKNGSTGGTITALASYLLDSKFVKGVLVAFPHKIQLIRSSEGLRGSQGSIYEEFPYQYDLEDLAKNQVAQVGKPCNMESGFKVNLSLLCSCTMKRSYEPILKENLLQRSVISRYFFKLLRRSEGCKSCRDHCGFQADISVGDSQVHKKRNHVIVWNGFGEIIWNEAMKRGYIEAEEIEFSHVVQTQPYLFGELITPSWILQKWRRGK